jgi:phenylacetate-CoA ligase
MAKITGRSDDMLIIRGVNVFPTQVEELVVKQPGLAAHYRLEVDREGNLDRLRVLVERVATAEPSQAGRELAHHIKSYIGVTAEVIVGEPGSVERSVGKAKRVIDRRRS